MTRDCQHENLIYLPSEIEHCYGEGVHILSDPFHMGLLSKLCHPQTVQPLVHHYVQKIYSMLFTTAINMFFPRVMVNCETRMKTFHSEGSYEGQIVDESLSLVMINLARAGTWPSHICYDSANYYFIPEKIRQDHFYLNRSVNSKGEVVGVDVSGCKIGGSVDKAYVLIPDPMGATGGTLCHVLDHYKSQVPGKAERYIALHLIITPEYIKRIKTDHPDLTILALRLDRGLSSPEILQTRPGTYWEQERGLNEKQYIVPGGGGLGEILNNSFV